MSNSRAAYAATEMELRVAKAMYVANPAKDYSWQEWEWLSYGQRLPWLRCASAAIRAMREPTTEMLAALKAHWHQPGKGRRSNLPQTKREWAVLIDAASPPKSWG